MKILIVEDEIRLAEVMASRLKNNHYDVEIVTDGKTGMEKASNGTYDLVLLDVMLPGVDGFSIMEEVKAMAPETRIIMVTARSEISDRLKGLKNGADDYITKPFHMEELLARVDLQLKKQQIAQENTLSFSDLELELGSGKLTNAETRESISLSSREYQIMEYFLRHPSMVLSKDQIYTHVWGWDHDLESNSLEAYLSFLRKKLRLLDSSVSIKSIRGMGYRLESADADA